MKELLLAPFVSDSPISLLEDMEEEELNKRKLEVVSFLLETIEDLTLGELTAICAFYKICYLFDRKPRSVNADERRLSSRSISVLLDKLTKEGKIVIGKNLKDFLFDLKTALKKKPILASIFRNEDLEVIASIS